MPHFTQSLKKELSFYGFEPVNLVTGSVLYERTDFSLLGIINLGNGIADNTPLPN